MSFARVSKLRQKYSNDMEVTFGHGIFKMLFMKSKWTTNKCRNNVSRNVTSLWDTQQNLQWGIFHPPLHHDILILLNRVTKRTNRHLVMQYSKHVIYLFIWSWQVIFTITAQPKLPQEWKQEHSFSQLNEMSLFSLQCDELANYTF